jgi:hypothetical protein
MSTEQLSTMEQNINLNVKEELQVKKYRATVYDIHDTTYAKELKKSFSNLENDLQNKFMLFTDNLMNEEQINRFSLLDAIDDFVKDFSKTEKKTEKKTIIDIIYNNVEWQNFANNAFNFRPYQSCSIM